MRWCNSVKNNNGITMAETIIATILICLIILVATSIVLSVNSSKNIFGADSNYSGEIVRLEEELKSWIMMYDQEDYSITANNNIAEALNSSGEKAYIEFLNGNMNFTFFEKDSFSVSLTTTKNVEFDIYDNNILSCTLFLKNGKSHKILHYIRAAENIMTGENYE